MTSRVGLFWLLIISVISIPAVSGAAVVQLPRTGSTICIDATGAEISCAGTGQDGEIQAGALWPDPRFIDHGDGTISDSLTGLIWTANAGTPTDGSCVGAGLSWLSALNYIACINGNNYLGHNDWRLPNINELESLVNLGVAQSFVWLTDQGFTNVGQIYWSSTSYAPNTGYAAWYVDLNTNKVQALAKTTSALIWPVRQ